MNAKTLLLMLAGMTLALGTTLMGPSPGSGQPPRAEAGRVRLIMIADTNDKPGSARFKKYAELTSEIFKQANEEDPGRPYDEAIMLMGDRATSRDLLKTIASLNVRPGLDTLAVFYFGHGASDERHAHFFTLSNTESIARKRVVAAIQARRPRLAVLLSGACAGVERSMREHLIGAAPINWQAMRALFIEQRGLADVNGASPGQYGCVVKLRDGTWISFFNQAVVDALSTAMADRLKTARAAADWKSFMRVLGEETNRMFKLYNFAQYPELKKIGQTSQDPYAWSLPTPLGSDDVTPPAPLPPDGGYGATRGLRKTRLALPLHVQLRSTAQGLLVAQVLPNGPAARAGIRAGDVLTAVNGRKMTFAQYNAFRTASPPPRQAVFTIAQRCECGCGKLLKDCNESCGGERGTGSCR